jgi:hypothetical protein
LSNFSVEISKAAMNWRGQPDASTEVARNQMCQGYGWSYSTAGLVCKKVFCIESNQVAGEEPTKAPVSSLKTGAALKSNSPR